MHDRLMPVTKIGDVDHGDDEEENVLGGGGGVKCGWGGGGAGSKVSSIKHIKTYA